MRGMSIRGVGDKGFTLVELLIAISVIGILAVISVNYFLSVQQEALASRYLTTTRTLEKGFIAKGVADGIDEWWRESDLEGCAGLYGSSPRIPGMVQNCGFGDFVPGDLEEIGQFAYDSDSDATDYVDGCAVPDPEYGGWVNPTKGVNILIKDEVTREVFLRMDATIDPDDEEETDITKFTCGKLRYWEERQNAYYTIDFNRSDAALRF